MKGRQDRNVYALLDIGRKAKRREKARSRRMNAPITALPRCKDDRKLVGCEKAGRHA
jgi:hypothetical protein